MTFAKQHPELAHLRTLLEDHYPCRLGLSKITCDLSLAAIDELWASHQKLSHDLAESMRGNGALASTNAELDRTNSYLQEYQDAIADITNHYDALQAQVDARSPINARVQELEARLKAAHISLDNAGLRNLDLHRHYDELLTAYRSLYVRLDNTLDEATRPDAFRQYDNP